MTTSDAKTILVDIINHLLASDPDSVLGNVLDDLDLSAAAALAVEDIAAALTVGRPQRLTVKGDGLRLSVLISDDRLYLLISAVDQTVYRLTGKQDERPVALIASLVTDGLIGVIGAPKTEYLVLEVVKTTEGVVIYPGCLHDVQSNLSDQKDYARLRLAADRFAPILKMLATLLENGTFMVGDMPILRRSKTPDFPALIL